MKISSDKKCNLTWENLDMAKKGKPFEKNWISPDSSTKQRHKDYVTEKVDKMQQNSRRRLYSHKAETITHIFCKFSKSPQRKYKSRHVWVGAQGDPQRTVQEIEKWINEQMVYAQPRIHPRKGDPHKSLGF